jgi:hypothetical protein
VAAAVSAVPPTEATPLSTEDDGKSVLEITAAQVNTTQPLHSLVRLADSSDLCLCLSLCVGVGC